MGNDIQLRIKFFQIIQECSEQNLCKDNLKKTLNQFETNKKYSLDKDSSLK